MVEVLGWVLLVSKLLAGDKEAARLDPEHPVWYLRRRPASRIVALSGCASASSTVSGDLAVTRAARRPPWHDRLLRRFRRRKDATVAPDSLRTGSTFPTPAATGDEGRKDQDEEANLNLDERLKLHEQRMVERLSRQLSESEKRSQAETERALAKTARDIAATQDDILSLRRAGAAALAAWPVGWVGALLALAGIVLFGLS